MKLAIGNDHVAIEMKNDIKAHLEGFLSFPISTIFSIDREEHGFRG